VRKRKEAVLYQIEKIFFFNVGWLGVGLRALNRTKYVCAKVG